MVSHVCRLLSLVLSASHASGCFPFGDLERDARLRAHLASIDGTVQSDESRVIVSLVGRSMVGEFELVHDRIVLPSSKRFVFLALPDDYLVVAHADRDRNLLPDAGEPIGWTRLSSDWFTGRRAVLEIRLDGSDPPLDLATIRPSGLVHLGTRTSLEAPRFDRSASDTGVWEPLRFMHEHGAGVFAVGPIDENRTPVVFVHGMGGTPREFAYLIAGLPHDMQPWVAHYPSGWALEDSSRYFARILTALQEQHDLDRVCIVAHSMGGLVARRAISIRVENGDRPLVRALITIASPMGGDPSAASGVAIAPAVVPAWRSLVPGSAFLRSLHQTPMPSGTEYTLVFTYDDDVVDLESQLTPRAQAEADMLRGFDAGHTAVLRDPELRHLVAARLQTLCGPPLSRGTPSARSYRVEPPQR